jgi:hypothetical protein
MAHRNINNVESNTTHILLSADTVLGGPLKSSNAVVLDLIQVLHTLRGINE